jgi:RNA polymerase sigma factor (sigma-70 family)
MLRLVLTIGPRMSCCSSIDAGRLVTNSPADEEVIEMASIKRRSDEDLLLATGRQAEAFGVFYRRHEPAMLLFFLRRTSSAEVAADLTAEVFAAALSGAHRFRPGKKPAIAWLYGIANNKLAASYSRGRVEERARKRLQAEPLVLTDDALERVEALADGEREMEIVDDLLRQLPPDQHDAVRAHVVDERPYQEIAKDLETSQAVIRQRVSRGLRSMRTGLSEEAR